VPQIGGPGSPAQADRAGGDLDRRRREQAARQACSGGRPAAGAGARRGRRRAGPGGVGTWNGIPVANWLSTRSWAKAHGGNTQITSGYRPGFDPHTASGRSEHQGTRYPHGAIDFGGFVDPVGLAHKLSFLRSLRAIKGPKPILPQGFRDDGHTSGTGHARGGIVPKQVLELARRRGWDARNARHVEEIAHGEAGYSPGVVSSDGGWGLTQLTPRVWHGPIGEGWKRLMNRLGGLHQMLNPVKNLVMARRMFADVGWQPWHRSRYLTASTAMHPHPHARVVPYRGRHQAKFRPHLSKGVRRLLARHPEIRLPGLKSFNRFADVASHLEDGSGHAERVWSAVSEMAQYTVDTNGDGEPDVVNRHGWKDPTTGKFVPGIDQAVKALERLIRFRDERLKALREQHAQAVLGASQLVPAIRERRGLQHQVKQRVWRNATQIGWLGKTLRQLDRKRHLTPGERAQHRRLGHQLRNLKLEQKRLVGFSDPDQLTPWRVSHPGSDSQLGKTQAWLKSATAARSDLFDKDRQVRLDISAARDELYLKPDGLKVQLADILGTQRPKPDTAQRDADLAELYKGQRDESRLRERVAERQFDVLRGLPPYGGSFDTGGVVPGPVGAARTIIAHGGETVVPGGDGGSIGDVTVHNHFAPGMEWLERYVDTRIERKGRSASRGATRALPGRGGGLF
jgi:hypothetical protein